MGAELPLEALLLIRVKKDASSGEMTWFPRYPKLAMTLLGTLCQELLGLAPGAVLTLDEANLLVNICMSAS